MRPLHELLIKAASRQGVAQPSRRGVLALAAAAPAAFGLNTVLAQVEAEKKLSQKDRNQRRRRRNDNRAKGSRRNDIRILNYALTLEHLEYAFYRDGLDQFNASDFDDFDDRDTQLFVRLGEIRDHEEAHVELLTETIEGLGGNPVEEQCYNFDAVEEQDGDFDFQDPAGFLQIAQLLENTGVSAYTGALADIRSGDLQTAGATIATVEARHAAYLNFINGDSPFPDDRDTPLSMEEILDAAGGFIEGPMPCDDDNGE